MSQAIFVYLSGLESVNAAIGSRDLAVVAAVAEEQADELRSIDDDYDVEEDYGPGVTAAELVTELINGRFDRDFYEFEGLYDRVFLVLCNQYGGGMIDDRLHRARAKWLDEIDATLAAGGVELRVQKLWCRAGAIVNPDLKRLNEVGYWRAEEMAAARPGLRASIPTVTDEEMRAALGAIDAWCRESGEYPDCTLVGWFA